MSQKNKPASSKHSHQHPAREARAVNPLKERSSSLVNAVHDADEGKHGHDLEGSDQHGAQYAAKQRVRKASEVAFDLGAVIQAAPRSDPQEIATYMAAVWKYLAELLTAPASTVDDAQAFAVWIGKLHDLRSRFTEDAEAMHELNALSAALQKRTVETLAAITGTNPAVYSGDEAPILN